MSKLKLFSILVLIYTIFLIGLSKAVADETVPFLPKNESNLDQVTGMFSSYPDIRVGTLSIETNDKLVHRENSVNFSRSSKSGPWVYYAFDAVQLQGNSSWLNYRGAKALGSATFSTGPNWRLASTLGVGQLTLKDFKQNTYNNSQDLMMYRVRSTYIPIAATEVSVESGNDFSYVGWVDDERRSQVTPVSSLSAEVESFTIPQWQLRTNIRKSYFIDGNRQLAWDNLIMRKLIDGGATQVKLGVGGGIMGYERSANYWSPLYMELYTGRMNFSHSFTKLVSTELNLAYGFHRFEDGHPLPEGSAELHLDLHGQSGWIVKLAAAVMDSENHNWWRRDLSVSAQMPL